MPTKHPIVPPIEENKDGILGKPPIMEESLEGVLGKPTAEAGDQFAQAQALPGLIHDPLSPTTMMPESELTVTRGLLSAELDALETRMLSMMQSVLGETKKVPAVHEYGITAVVVGAEVNCPHCNLRLQGPAKITQVGRQHQGLYEHPFDDSPKLAGQKCPLKGHKFEAPVMFLKSVKPLPLTETTK